MDTLDDYQIPYGLMAEFDTPADAMHAAETVRDAGFTRWDVQTIRFPLQIFRKCSPDIAEMSVHFSDFAESFQ